MKKQKLLERIARALEASIPDAPKSVDWRCHYAAVWHVDKGQGYLTPILADSPVTLDDLVGIETQRQRVESNTRQFLNHFPANNVLMWGARGTGKSSLVRALLHHYADQGLRLIQVDREDLILMPSILVLLADQPYRFIIYCDDLSFEEDDVSYKRLKSALDGALSRTPDNVLLYATSNRRHLIPEAASDNLKTEWVDGELHPGDAIEEKISLSDRFGEWIGFYPFDQPTFLRAAEHWVAALAKRYSISLPWSEAVSLEAIRFAQSRGVRNGRVAQQFANYWVGQQLLKRENERC